MPCVAGVAIVFQKLRDSLVQAHTCMNRSTPRTLQEPWALSTLDVDSGARVLVGHRVYTRDTAHRQAATNAAPLYCRIVTRYNLPTPAHAQFSPYRYIKCATQLPKPRVHRYAARL